MRIGNPRQGFGTDHHNFFGISGFNEIIARDHAVQPPRASEGDVIGHRVGILDSEFVLDPRSNGRHHIGGVVFGFNIPEILCDDDVIQALPVDPVERVFGGQISHVGGGQMVFDIAPLTNAGNFLQLVDYIFICLGNFFPVSVIKLMIKKSFVRYRDGRNVTAGCGYDRSWHDRLNIISKCLSSR